MFVYCIWLVLAKRLFYHTKNPVADTEAALLYAEPKAGDNSTILVSKKHLIESAQYNHDISKF